MGDRPERLFERARELGPDEGAAFLREACREEPELRDELLSLLERDARAEAFFGLMAGASRTVSVHPSDEEVAPGSRLGPYRVVERIGRGGMGTVYRARDERLGRDVALKFLSPRGEADDGARAELFAEARAAAALEHPNVCTVHEIGETPDGRPFIAMAFHRGETLKERLLRGPLPAMEAVAVAGQVAAALEAAHAVGIVHRDVKPANVILTVGGTVKVLDFGLAAPADPRDAGGGGRQGTVPYMAPEQLRGEPLDARSDLWSLGVVLYEMLTGRRPFRGEDEVALLHAVLREEPEPVLTAAPGTPRPVAAIVERLLRKDPDARYPSAGELRAGLERARSVADGAPATGAPAGRRGWIVGVGLTALMAAAVVLLVARTDAGGAGGADVRRDRSPDVAAYELYQRAGEQSLFRSDEGVRRGVGYLLRAVELDPDYAAAHARLAIFSTVLSRWTARGAATDSAAVRARSAALRGVALDDSLAEAHASLGLVRQLLDHEWTEAAAELERAIELDPSDARFHQWLAQLYLQTGRPEEALAPAARALELDPLSPTSHAELAHALLATGRADEALARLERIARLQPPLLRTATYIAQAYAIEGMWSEAVRALEPQALGGEPQTLGLYGYVLARAGRREDALRVRTELLERWRRGSARAFEVAVVYAGLGELEGAFAWLERAVEDGSATQGTVHVMSPIFTDLRADPRFERIAGELGLPPGRSGPRPRPAGPP